MKISKLNNCQRSTIEGKFFVGWFYYFLLITVVLLSAAMMIGAALIVLLGIILLSDSNPPNTFHTYFTMAILTAGPGSYPIFFVVALVLTSIRLKQGDKAQALAWQLLPLATIPTTIGIYILIPICSAVWGIFN